jgi:two-component system, sensor histidine kinase
MMDSGDRPERESLHEQLRRIYDLTAAVSRAADPQVLYESALDALEATVRPSRSAVLVFDRHDVLRVVAGRGISQRYRAATEGQCPWPSDALHPQPIIVEDIAAESVPADRRHALRSEGVTAFACFPLLHAGRLFGALTVYYGGRHHFPGSETELCETVARHIAFALSAGKGEQARDQVVARERAARARAEGLANIGRELAQSLDVAVVSRRIVESVHDLLEGQLAILYAVEESGTLRCLAVAGAGRPVFGPGTVLASGAGVVGLAVDNQRPVVTFDLLSDPRLTIPDDLHRAITAVGHRAACAAPLIIEGGVVGALAVGDRLGRTFDDEAIALLEVFADHAAMAVRNAGLYQTAHRRLRQTETLLAVNQSVGETWNLTERLRRLARELARAFGADMGGAYLVEGDSLRALAGYHVPTHLLTDFRIATFPIRGHRFVEQARVTRHSVWSSEAGQDRRIDRPSFDRFPHRSILLVPLFIADEFIGALSGIWWHDRRLFQADELRLADAIGRQAALAIDNARLYQETERRRAEAEAANRAKDEFLAMLGHELRNPLGAISNALSVLDRLGKSDDRAFQMRGIIARQVQHLARLVDDLLQVSRVVSGKVPLHLQQLDLRAVAEGVLATFHYAGRTQGHRIVLDGDAALVRGDATRLEQVVTNLLDNALKFTPVGGDITVTVTQEDGQAVLSVRDTGVGISPELLPHIFDLFTQGRQGLERAQGGLGLGLTLVKRLVDLHGGTVQALSEGTGRGAEFILRVPSTAAADMSQARPDAPLVSRQRVLIIEDQPDPRDALRSLLELDGHMVQEAVDGQEGLQLLLAWRPDIAFVDLGLSRLDGYEVARAARATPEGQKFFLVALTGYGQQKDRRRVISAGFNAHLVKPVEYQELLRALAEAARFGHETIPAMEADHPTDPPPP